MWGQGRMRLDEISAIEGSIVYLLNIDAGFDGGWELDNILLLVLLMGDLVSLVAFEQFKRGAFFVAQTFRQTWQLPSYCSNWTPRLQWAWSIANTIYGDSNIRAGAWGWGDMLVPHHIYCSWNNGLWCTSEAWGIQGPSQEELHLSPLQVRSYTIKICVIIMRRSILFHP